MRLKQHIAISLFFSACLLAISKSWIIFGSSLISGVLIDIDHILDYFMVHGLNMRIRQFFEECHNHKILRVRLIFHSWELLFLLSISAFIVRWNPWIVGTIAGFTQHIILDQVFNKPNRWTYFFFWRLKNGFSVKRYFQID
ncbi:MAG: hypothetical protein H8D23_34185 [Candidatus Brocadiales bacterium]|nr:hypothetical protein [Candidatus Brocadiales bacterium]